MIIGKSALENGTFTGDIITGFAALPAVGVRAA
jgi:hypothetical protein